MQYYQQLDSVRGVAALLVVFFHWTQARFGKEWSILGSIGVITFFVLSGFLITRILLQAKEQNLSNGKNHWTTLKNFIIRRVLRIFPIYYLVIAIACIFSDFFQLDMSEGFWYYMTYTSNFYYYQLEGPKSILGITWTLAIEEQFYLFFPWFVLFLKKNWMKYFLWILFIIGLLFFRKFFKFLLKGLSLQEWILYTKSIPMLTPSAFDSLGIGALLAYFTVYAKNKVFQHFKLISAFGILSIILFIASKWKLIPFINHTTCISVASLWLIAAILYEKRIFLLDFFLNNRVLILLGKISYGIYLYHQMFAYVYNKSKKAMDIIIPNFWVDFACKFTLLIVVAYGSWRFIEQPIVRLKKYFPYT